ncbi:MAG: hypothetical protein ABI898_03665 [Sphingomonadales bacterium]
MFLLALAAAASSVPTDIANAERAFARRAQTDGQWAAFRATAAPDAIMFVPDVKPVAVALHGAVEPKVSVMWWPATIAHSCDGSLGYSTGPWVRAASAGTGTYSTIWKRVGTGYRWVLDHGRGTPKLIPAGNAPAVIVPVCDGASPSGAAAREAEYTKLAAAVAARAGVDGAGAFASSAASDVLVQNEDALPARGTSALPPTKFGAALASGRSDDWTLAWASRALLGGQPGAHDLRVWQWRGREGWKLVVYETIGLK